MKKLIHGIAALFLLTLFGCYKIHKEVTVERDCTGTYLRFHEKDYHVCNLEKTNAYDDGETVTATFKKIKECNGSASDAIVCLMFHENEGWIEVTKIK